MSWATPRTTPAFAIGGRTSVRAGVFTVMRTETAEKCLALCERVLAAQGDHAEPLIVKLQHDLTEVLKIETTVREQNPTTP